MRGTRRVVRTVAVAVTAILGLATAGAAATSSDPGYDISWPQCSRADGGYGLPLPPTDAPMVVIGLTAGRPFTVNPCLAEQVGWARRYGVPTSAYLMAGYPTTAQLDAHGTRGPWTGTSPAARLRNTGYAEALDARDRLAANGLGFTPSMIWVDVESRVAQPWQSGSATARAHNRWVIEGIMRALDDHDIRYGIYANTDAWRTITGPWALPGVPFWGTVGQRGAAAAAAACTAPSLSSGELLMVQWTDTVRDYDVRCSGFTMAPAHPYPPVTPHDLTDDWRTDLLARSTAGHLFLYPQTTASTLGGRRRLGGNWRAYDQVLLPGDLSGDGIPDVLGATRTGQLHLYPGTGTGGIAATPRVIGRYGWEVFDLLLTPGDFDGDGIPDVLARTRTGQLWLYRGNGSGGLGSRYLISSGWLMFDAVTSPGDLTGDGVPDVLGRTASGQLWLYPGNGTGSFAARTMIGRYGWQIFDLLRGVPDLTGDGTADLVARTSSGDLWVYPGNGAGGLSVRRLLGRYGWGIYDTLA